MHRALRCWIPGKLADIITLDTKQLHLTPVNDPVAAIVYGATGIDVSTVVVNGNIVLEEKQFTHLEPTKVIDATNTAMEKIRSQLAK